jgi:hypothetical protein
MIRSIVNEANGPVALRVLTASRNPDSMLTSSLRGGWYWRVAKKATTTIPIEAPCIPEVPEPYCSRRGWLCLAMQVVGRVQPR